MGNTALMVLAFIGAIAGCTAFIYVGIVAGHALNAERKARTSRLSESARRVRQRDADQPETMRDDTVELPIHHDVAVHEDDMQPQRRRVQMRGELPRS